MPAAKRFSIDVNGNKQTTQTYNINAGEGVRGEGLRFRLPAGNKVELTDETTHAGPKSIKAQRVGENLHIAFQNTDIKSPDVIIEGFYAKGKAGELIGKGSNGKYYEYSVVSDDKLPADNAVLTSSLSSKATTAWGDAGAAVETVVSAERAGVIVAPGSSESARAAAPTSPSSTGKGVKSPAPAPDATPVASKPVAAPESDGGGFSLGTVGWVLGGVALVGLAAAGGGGGGGDSTPAPAPAPAGPSITLSGPGTVDEAAGTATYTATLSAASTDVVKVQYGVVAGTATAGSDFNAVSGELTFAAGVTSQTFKVPVLEDSLSEGNENYVVSLSSPTNATLSATPNVTTTISANDTQTVTLAGPGTVDEAAGTATYTATLSSAATSVVSVQFAATAGTATAGADFNAVTGTLNFAAGVTTQTFSVPITNDTTVEGAQTLVVSLATPTNAALGTTSSVTTSITDNDTQTVTGNTPTSAGVAEGTAAVFNVTLNSKAEIAVQHSFVIGGTSTAGTDRGDPVFSDGVTYDANSGKITVPAGVSSFTVTVDTKTGDGFEFAETIVATVDTTAATVNILLNFGSSEGTDTAATSSDTSSAATAPDLLKSLVVSDEPQALVLMDGTGSSAAKLVFAESLASSGEAKPASADHVSAADTTALAYSAGTATDDLLTHSATAPTVTGA